MNFWSYDGETWDTHETAEAARANCQSALDYFRSESNRDGWPDDIESIAWGPIAERVVETSRIEHLDACGPDGCDDECPVTSGFDFDADYELAPVAGDLDAHAVPFEPLLDEYGRDLNAPNVTPLAPFNRTEVDIIAGTDSPDGDGWEPVHAFVDSNGMNCVLWRREVSP